MSWVSRDSLGNLRANPVSKAGMPKTFAWKFGVPNDSACLAGLRRSGVKTRLGLVVFLIGLAPMGCATQLTSDNTAADFEAANGVLPLKRVRLYASGVGYFERSGRMQGGSAALPVPAGHLDDALTSLVVLSADQGVGSVSFPSRLSPAVARARAGLPADQETPLSYDKVLGSLRGEQVELTFVATSTSETKTHVRGRIIDVVAVQPDHPSYDHGLPHQVVAKDQTHIEDKERLQVLLLSESGEVLRLDSAALDAVRPLDEFVARRFQAALSARLATRSNQRQLLTLTGDASRERELTLAYLAEAATWRASYRLLLSTPNAAASKPRLHAWALVHNDTDEPWQNIHLELVHGRPASFLFPITAPRYERRELQTPDTELSSVPQLSTTTPDAMWGDFSDYDGEPIGRVGSEGVSGIGSGQGFGSGHGGLGGSHRSKAPTIRRGASRAQSDLLWVGDLAERAGVVTTAPQTQPTYRVTETISLPPQHSAMVPFMNTAVSALPIVWFDGFASEAERAVGINNTTEHILPAGPLSVYDAGGFLGEALLSTLKPGDRQFAQIGDEPDVSIQAGRPVSSQEVKHVDFRDGRLRTHIIVKSSVRLSFHNQSGQRREAYVVMDVVRNANIEGSERIDFETTTERAFAVFQLPTGQGAERTLIVQEAISEETPSESVELDELRSLQALNLPSEEKQVLKAAEPYLEAWDVARQADAELKLDVEGVESEVTRLREHLESVGKSEAPASAPLVARILEREDHLATLRVKERAQAKELAHRQSDFEGVLAQLENFRAQILAAQIPTRK